MSDINTFFKGRPFSVGDIVVPADGSRYRGEITYVSKEEDVIRHKCLKTGTAYEKSYFGFYCRYVHEDEYRPFDPKEGL